MVTINSVGSPTISASDRLTFTLFLAIALHAAVILGVTFQDIGDLFVDRSIHTMEVTLVQHDSQTLPVKPDYLAQFNQEGSSPPVEMQRLSTTDGSEDSDNRTRETLTVDTVPLESLPVGKMLRDNRHVEQPVISSINDNAASAIDQATGKDGERGRQGDLASLEARLENQRQSLSSQPRIKRLTTLSTIASVDALYLDNWRRKIETTGNLHYPETANRQRLYGSLRMMVAVLPDGTLSNIEILESSGNQVLDNAAVGIVKRAAPFMPFPEELRLTTDVLEIIRTWQFSPSGELKFKFG